MIITDSDKQELLVNISSAKGNPAVLDGALTWASSNEAIITVTAGTDDGMSATMVAVGPVGTAQISARGDADRGDGVREIVGTLDVEVIGGEAMVITIGPASTTPPA